MSPILLHLIASLAYLALAFYLWKDLQRGRNAPMKQGARVAHALVAVPLLIHTALLSQSMVRADGLYLGVGNAISLIMALAVLICPLSSSISPLTFGHRPVDEHYCSS